MMVDPVTVAGFIALDTFLKDFNTSNIESTLRLKVIPNFKLAAVYWPLAIFVGLHFLPPHV